MNWDLQTLFRRHSREMVGASRRQGLRRDVAEDMVQDVFLRILAVPPAEDVANHNPRAYLLRAARNLGINHHKREARAATAELTSAVADRITDPAPLPDAALASRQRLAAVEAALGELPERTRRAFELHRIGGLTIQEVATEIDLSVSRTWTLIRDAYRHLLARVGDEG